MTIDVYPPSGAASDAEWLKVVNRKDETGNAADPAPRTIVRVHIPGNLLVFEVPRR